MRESRPRDRAAWLAGFLCVSALLVATRFASLDSDSVRYATLSAKLSALPIAQWVAPEWWGLGPDSDVTGYFLEHPAGLFLIPAALGRLGVPAEQAPYVFGIAAGLVALWLAAALVGRVTSREEGRAALVLLQFMPVAFVFRIRDNHEYPMLVCLLASLLALEGVTQSWMWLPVVALAFAAGLLVKGVFVALVLMGAGLWILINPTNGSKGRQMFACLAGLASMAAVGWAYDQWYLRETGHRFWIAYWQRQLAPMRVASPLGQAGTFAAHLGFYFARLLLHPAPWSLALLWAAWRRRRLPDRPQERRGVHFVLAFTAGSILLLSVASRFAERYAFSPTYVIAGGGAVAAYRFWPAVRNGLAKLDARVPALPAVVWVTLMVLRLVLGPWLPRR